MTDRESSPPRSGTALLVEDDDAVRRAVRRMLERLGYSVLEAPDGEAGLTVAAGHTGTIDVVITDLMMPRMNGGDFANALAKTHPGVRVVFASGYTDDTIVRRGLLTSGHAFLQKPFTADQLAQAIAKLSASP